MGTAPGGISLPLGTATILPFPADTLLLYTAHSNTAANDFFNITTISPLMMTRGKKKSSYKVIPIPLCGWFGQVCEQKSASTRDKTDSC
jgi:hypothetical protein